MGLSTAVLQCTSCTLQGLYNAHTCIYTMRFHVYVQLCTSVGPAPSRVCTTRTHAPTYKIRFHGYVQLGSSVRPELWTALTQSPVKRVHRLLYLSVNTYMLYICTFILYIWTLNLFPVFLASSLDPIWL